VQRPIEFGTVDVEDLGLAIAAGKKPTVGGDRRFSGAPSAQNDAIGQRC
jgi:hypothetical protein